MKKVDVIKYISELLCKHDCVIIPGFGGFIGNYSPAIINAVNHTFYPPSKSLLFNIHLKQNDGLLATHISQAEEISFEQAMELILMMVSTWTQELGKGNTLILENVGTIVKENSDIIQFVQDLSFNYLPEAYGLTPFVSPAIKRPGIQDKIEKKIQRYINTPSGHPLRLTRTLKRAAIIAIPLGIAAYLSISNIDQIRKFHENYSGFFFSSPTSAIEKRKESPNILLKRSLIPEPKPASSIQPIPVTKILPAHNSGTLANSDPLPAKPFAIIVGAFRFRENADNMVTKLKKAGYDAGIYDITSTGLFRVTVGSFISRNEAILQLEAVRSKYNSSAWLLSK